MTDRNTGDPERQARLQEIDRAALPSVIDARAMMRDYQQHRQEERREGWEQKREDAQRASNEKYWPTNPPQAERKSLGLFQQAATEAGRDERTENLKGETARIWQAFRESDPAFSAKSEKALDEALKNGRSFLRTTTNAKAFAAALDNKGISFAITTKDEANRSHKEAEFARTLGKYAPRFKEGEIVIVTEPGVEYMRNGEMAAPGRVHKLDQSLAAKFLKALDNKSGWILTHQDSPMGAIAARSQLQGIDATTRASDERAQLRREDRTAERLERATTINAAERTGGKGINVHAVIGKPASAVKDVFTIGEKTLGPLLFSLFDSKSPQQQERDDRQAERNTDKTNAEAEIKIDFAQYTADRAQEKHNHQEQQAARDRQREHERDR